MPRRETVPNYLEATFRAAHAARLAESIPQSLIKCARRSGGRGWLLLRLTLKPCIDFDGLGHELVAGGLQSFRYRLLEARQGGTAEAFLTQNQEILYIGAAPVLIRNRMHGRSA